MSWVITPQLKSVDGVPVGTPYGGGYVAGYISHTADGNPTHALIVAPRATGATGTGYTLTTMLAWKTANTTTTGANSVFDGVANSAAITTAGIADHPAAQFCVNLSIGGFSDWYLPSQAEQEIAYFNLKPTTDSNLFGSLESNIYAVPARSTVYTASYPAQTNLALFKSGGGQAYEAQVHWASNEINATNARRQSFANGQMNTANVTKGITYAVRAFRRIAL
jgi:hypothetical protein